MIVHHLSNSHSHVVLWLLEELGMEYEIVHHQRDPQTRRSLKHFAQFIRRRRLR